MNLYFLSIQEHFEIYQFLIFYFLLFTIGMSRQDTVPIPDPIVTHSDCHPDPKDDQIVSLYFLVEPVAQINYCYQNQTCHSLMSSVSTPTNNPWCPVLCAHRSELEGP